MYTQCEYSRNNMEEQYSCPVCFRSFSELKNLLLHVQQHSAENKFLCFYCCIAFSTRNELAGHYIIEHANSNEVVLPELGSNDCNDTISEYKCQLCGSTFSNSRALGMHVRVSHTMKMKRKKKGRTANPPKKVVKKSKKWIEKSNGSTEKAEQKRKDHLPLDKEKNISNKRRRPDKEATPVETISFQTADDHGNPSTSDTPSSRTYKKPVWCKACVSSFRTKCQYSLHKCKRVCGLCGSVLGSESSLYTHNLKYHNRVRCCICHQIFQNYMDFSSHWKATHENNVESTGKRKRKAFTLIKSKATLKKPMTQKTKIVTVDNSLESISKTAKYTGAKPKSGMISGKPHKKYKCSRCSSAFSDYGQCYYHRSRMHKGDKMCFILNLACTNRLKCKFCRKTFRSSGFFSRHMVDFHSSTLRCTLCLRIFKSKPEYFKHRASEHKGLGDYDVLNSELSNPPSSAENTYDTGSEQSMAHDCRTSKDNEEASVASSRPSREIANEQDSDTSECSVRVAAGIKPKSSSAVLLSYRPKYTKRSNRKNVSEPQSFKRPLRTRSDYLKTRRPEETLSSQATFEKHNQFHGSDIQEKIPSKEISYQKQKNKGHSQNRFQCESYELPLSGSENEEDERGSENLGFRASEGNNPTALDGRKFCILDESFKLSTMHDVKRLTLDPEFEVHDGCQICTSILVVLGVYKPSKQEVPDSVQCPLCFQYFQNRNLYYRHKKRDHPESGPVCVNCGLGFENLPALRSHMRDEKSALDELSKSDGDRAFRTTEEKSPYMLLSMSAPKVESYSSVSPREKDDLQTLEDPSFILDNLLVKIEKDDSVDSITQDHQLEREVSDDDDCMIIEEISFVNGKHGRIGSEWGCKNVGVREDSNSSAESIRTPFVQLPPLNEAIYQTAHVFNSVASSRSTTGCSQHKNVIYNRSLLQEDDGVLDLTLKDRSLNLENLGTANCPDVETVKNSRQETTSNSFSLRSFRIKTVSSTYTATAASQGDTTSAFIGQNLKGRSRQSPEPSLTSFPRTSVCAFEASFPDNNLTTFSAICHPKGGDSRETDSSLHRLCSTFLPVTGRSSPRFSSFRESKSVGIQESAIMPISFTGNESIDEIALQMDGNSTSASNDRRSSSFQHQRIVSVTGNPEHSSKCHISAAEINSDILNSVKPTEKAREKESGPPSGFRPLDLTLVKEEPPSEMPDMFELVSTENSDGNIFVPNTEPTKPYFQKPGDKFFHKCENCSKRFQDLLRLKFHSKNCHGSPFLRQTN